MERYSGRSDAEIIELFFKREEKAIYETDRKYGAFLYRIADNILHDRSDSEECQNDTYLKLWNTIPPTRPLVFSSFIACIIRNIAVNRYKHNMNKKHIPSELTVSMEDLEDYLFTQDDVEMKSSSNELGTLINLFMKTLSGRQRYIFIGRFYMADTLETIAKELGINSSTVHRELKKIKQALKLYLKRNGVNV